MGICVEIECPKCHKEFVVSPSMLKLNVDFHCPWCNVNFPKAQSPRIRE